MDKTEKNAYCYVGTDILGDEARQECKAERFLPYLWRQGQGPMPQPQAPAEKSPSASSSTGIEGQQEEKVEALPSSLSGMARHFQAQRAAQAKRRVHVTSQPPRCGSDHVYVLYGSARCLPGNNTACELCLHVNQYQHAGPSYAN